MMERRITDMMNRAEYKKRRGALRKLLGAIGPPIVKQRPLIEYCFGAIVRPSDKLWYIYNYNTNNCIATINCLEAIAVIRYRAKSHYSPILKTFKFGPKIKTLSVVSDNLAQHRRWLKDGLKSKIKNKLQSTTPGATLDPRQAEHIFRGSSIRIPSIQWSPSSLEPAYRHRDGRLRDSRGRFVSQSSRRASTREFLANAPSGWGRQLTAQDIRMANEALSRNGRQSEANAMQQFYDMSSYMTSRTTPVQEIVEAQEPIGSESGYTEVDDQGLPF